MLVCGWGQVISSQQMSNAGVTASLSKFLFHFILFCRQCIAFQSNLICCSVMQQNSCNYIEWLRNFVEHTPSDTIRTHSFSIHGFNKKESKLRLWNMLLQCTWYKKTLFQIKNIERGKITGKIWVMYKNTKTRNDTKNSSPQYQRCVVTTHLWLYQNFTLSLKKTQTQKWAIVLKVSGSSTTPNSTRRTSCKIWNFPVDSPKFSM